jgi:hypothetical protein
VLLAEFLLPRSRNITVSTATEICPGARRWWLTPVILTNQEAEIRRIVIQSQPRQIV